MTVVLWEYQRWAQGVNRVVHRATINVKCQVETKSITNIQIKLSLDEQMLHYYSVVPELVPKRFIL